VAKLDVVDVAEKPLEALAAEAELAEERDVTNAGAVALAVSRLMGRFSFYTLNNFPTTYLPASVAVRTPPLLIISF
jgi:hypothetical protein